MPIQAYKCVECGAVTESSTKSGRIRCSACGSSLTAPTETKAVKSAGCCSGNNGGRPKGCG